MRRIESGLRNLADAVAAGMLAAIFAIFVLQIVFRYLLNLPIGWTVEACLTLWLWLVLFGAAFCLRESDHVRFDMLEQTVGPNTRRPLALASALALLAGFAAVLPASWSYVSFYRIKPSATLRIPLAYVFSIFLVFCVSLIVRYGLGVVRLVRELRDGRG